MDLQRRAFSLHYLDLLWKSMYLYMAHKYLCDFLLSFVIVHWPHKSFPYIICF